MTDFSNRYAAKQNVITRDTLLSDEFFKQASAAMGEKGWSAAELDASLAAALAARPKTPAAAEDVWLFGYGSLIWNPAFHFADRRIARLHGWHRRFCLWTEMGRGSPGAPGLVLGLKSGGSCIGMAFRIPAAEAETELALVWRREMLHGSYLPRWVTIDCTDLGSVPALTFVVNTKHPRHAGRLDIETVTRTLARASGHFGRCADYFFSTIHALEELGIHDAQLFQLYDRVIRLCAEQTQAERAEVERLGAERATAAHEEAPCPCTDAAAELAEKPL
ncbi:MAG TPA: gamma-glutamylcyclotransferase [Stellaceae bacterium]|nr:gamma-glutamylcyclotransferase [Stellaceae bacterium]